MSNKRNCPWCGFSYADKKQGREYLYHDEETCELHHLRRVNGAAVKFVNSHEAALAGMCDLEGEHFEELRALILPAGGNDSE